MTKVSEIIEGRHETFTFPVGTSNKMIASTEHVLNSVNGLAQTYQYSVPTTGASITAVPVGIDHTVFMEPAGTLATLTVVIPVTPTQANQTITLHSTQTISALTVSGGTIDGLVTALSPNVPVKLSYVSSINKWVPVLTGILGWNDIIGTIVVKGNGANDPTWTTFITNINAYSFSATVLKEVWVYFHVDHGYAPGTPIYLHVHWSTAGTDTGVVRWVFDYTVAKGHQQQAWGVTTSVAVEQAATGTPYYHMIGEVSAVNTIPSTNIEPDSLILVHVYRDAANPNDTCTDAAFLLLADCHYQVDRFSTRNKSPNFYT